MSREPRILYLDDIPTPYRLGVFRRIASVWEGSFRVAFCAEAEPGRTFDLDFSGIDTVILDGRQWRPLNQVNPYSFKWNPGVIRLLEDYKPDVVVLAGYAHPTMIRAASWCISRGTPYAITCETSAKSTATTGLRWKARRCAIGWMIRNMSFGLPVGKHAAAYLRQLGPTNSPMYYFPNTPDTKLFQSTAESMSRSSQREAVRERYGFFAGWPLFVFIGRLIDAKRPLDVIDAFQELGTEEQASLLIVGDGPMMSIVRHRISGDARIACAGWINDQRELARILAASNALVLPSEHEPWGAVVNEAMASGTCVIATDRVGSAIELIRHGKDGFVVSVCDVPAICEAMHYLIKNPNECEKMGEAAQKNAVQHGAEYAASNLLEGVKEVICRGSKQTL